MVKRTHKLLGLFFAVSIILSLITTKVNYAQDNSHRFYEAWQIGLHPGTAKFYGTISDKNKGLSNINPFSGSFYQDRTFLYGITLTKRFSPMVWTRVNLLTGTLGSTNEGLNLYFKSNIVEFSGLVMLNVLEIIQGNNPERMVDAYLFVGTGMVSYTSWKRNLKNDSLIESEGAGKNKSYDMIIPIGFGVNFRVTEQFHVTGEFSLRNIRSDRMDAHTIDGHSREGYGLISLGLNYAFDMPEGVFQKGSRYNGKSNDPAIKAYNKKKTTVMKTKAYKQSLRTKRQVEREKKDWLIFKLFRKTKLDMATE